MDNSPSIAQPFISQDAHFGTDETEVPPDQVTDSGFKPWTRLPEQILRPKPLEGGKLVKPQPRYVISFIDPSLQPNVVLRALYPNGDRVPPKEEEKVAATSFDNSDSEKACASLPPNHHSFEFSESGDEHDGKKKLNGGGRPQNSYSYSVETIKAMMCEYIDKICLKLESGKFRTDAFRTKFVRVIMKLPLIICQSKNPPVIRTALYKSKTLREYRAAFKRTYNILNGLLKSCPASHAEIGRVNFVDFCALHFPSQKVIKIAEQTKDA